MKAIIAHWREHYLPPSIRDLCDALGIKSPNGIVCHLKALRQRGLLVGTANHRSRAIIPVEVRDIIKGNLKAYTLSK